jgi:hypothetical protein
MVDKIRDAAMMKWAYGFIAIGLLSVYFLKDRRWIARTTGVIYAVAAVMGLYGLYNNAILVYGAGLIGLGLIGSAAVFLLVPLK